MVPTEPLANAPPDAALGRLLLALARHAIARELGLADPPPNLGAPPPRALEKPAATFVTLTRDGRLRGCIGTLEACRPLGEDVAANARAAAFRDPRFAPVSVEEWSLLDLEVSLLQTPQPLAAAGEADALAALVPGEDGLILRYGAHCATFLPQVWEALPEPPRFLAELKAKAGLPRDFWAPQVELATYRVHKWRQHRGERP